MRPRDTFSRNLLHRPADNGLAAVALMGLDCVELSFPNALAYLRTIA